jgi:hypothetical protein
MIIAARLQKVTNLADDLMVTLIHKWLVHRAHEAVGGLVGKIYESSVPIATTRTV